MNRSAALVAIAAAVAAIGSTGCKKKRGGEVEIGRMIREMRGFKDRMCACKDKACADEVTAAVKSWSEDLAKSGLMDGHKPSSQDSSKIELIMGQYSDCMSKLSGLPPAPVHIDDLLRKEIAALGKDLVLSEILIEYANADGALDPTYGKLSLRTGKLPPPDPADDPSRPIGAPVSAAPDHDGSRDMDCPSLVVGNHGETRATGPCMVMAHLAQPKCSVHEVWRQAIAAGAPERGLAKLRLQSDGEPPGQRWIFTIDDDPRKIHFVHEVSDACPPVLEKQ